MDPDDEEDTLARNLGEENYDEKKLKKEHASESHLIAPPRNLPALSDLSPWYLQSTRKVFRT